MSAPYRYRTLDGDRYGSSYARARARQDAATMARETGQIVELIDPGRGVFHVRRASDRRARWIKVGEVAAQAAE
jgi:hypothetical protein